MALLAMLSVQTGSALSVGLIEQVGAGGTAWLRLTMGAFVFVVLVRPSPQSLRRTDVPVLVALGVATGLMTLAFLSAIERIDLGTAVAIEFLGPLTVAALRSGSRRGLVLPLVALAGVLLLTEPWHGEVDPLGLGFAALGAAGWASYIVLTQHVGDRLTGVDGLAFTIPVAAATAAVVGLPQALGHLTPGVLVTALGLALLLPCLPFALEMIALRRMTPLAFGTLMALEPAIGVLLGLVVLGQRPGPWQALGVVLVVGAGAAAQRGGGRDRPTPDALT